jgi:putative membrane protein
MMGWYGGGMTGFAWVGMGLFWLVLVGVIAWLASRLWSARPQEPSAPTVMPIAPASTPTDVGAGPALEILDRRLAAGEIDVETYRTIRATILEGRGGR